MKIAILQDDFPPESVGGAGIVAEQLAEKIKEFGHDVFVISASFNRTDEMEMRNGLRIYRLRSRPFGSWKNYLCLYNYFLVGKIEKILRKEQPDIAHCHNLSSALSYHSLALCRKNARTVFLTAHDSMLFSFGKLFVGDDIKKIRYKISLTEQIEQAGKAYNPLRNIFIKNYLRNVDKIFAVSASLAKALETNGITGVEVVHNCIDIKKISRKDEASIEEFKKQNNLFDKKIILFSGRISRSKGAESILAAVKSLKQKVQNVLLLIVGESNAFYLARMDRLIKEWNLQENVMFFGHVPFHEMELFYKSSDIVVVPSLYLDPFPTVNLEASACKKPVVGTCFGGTPEIILDGKTGYIVNPFDTSLLAQKIKDLLDNSDKARQFGLAGFERVKQFFSLDKQVAKILNLYQIKLLRSKFLTQQR